MTLWSKRAFVELSQIMLFSFCAIPTQFKSGFHPCLPLQGSAVQSLLGHFCGFYSLDLDLEKVYLVGNLAKGQKTDIIDLVLVGDNLNKPFLIEQIEKAEKKMKKT